jgi:ferrous iron transport protein B
MILSGDESLRRWLVRNLDPVRLNQIEGIRAALAATTALPLSQIISRHRALAVQRLFALVTQKTEGRESALAAFLGRTMMHPFWGVPWLALVLYATWLVVGVFGAGTVVDLIEEGLFNGYINPAAVRVFSFVPVPFLRDLFVGEYGIITMALTYGIAIVLPVVFFFFVTFGVLEDSGYLPRLAVQVNQIFRRLGLNGKAVLPMVLGLGCDTMATLTTRILETRRERTIVTLLLALGVPCSAQLGVILGLLTTAKSLFIWAGVVGLVLLAVGYLAGKVMPGQSSDFILEVPPVRLPRLGNILYKTLARTEWYLKEALPLFVLGTLVLFVLDRLGLLGMIEQWSAPVVTGVLGLPEEAAKVFIMGFLRRDYGGAGLKTMFDAGQLSDDQVLVSIVTLTLFIPCVANFLVMAKERGWKTAFAMAAFIVPVAVLTGGAVRLLLRSGIL